MWSEIPDTPEIDREGTLELVASRLFAGYDVNVKSERDQPVVIFTASDYTIKPDVKITSPDLRGMALKWFEHDITGMTEEISCIAGEIPQSALTWADDALREIVGKIIAERLPGWEFSLQIFISQNSTLINLTFRPSTPMILAIQPSLLSRTIPVMFRSDLEAKLIPEFSPLIGIPVRWAEIHNDDIEKHAREFLEDRNSVENMRANVNIKFLPGTVPNLEARVDSEDFMFQMWVAAYAGLDGRYPEAGAFFGYRFDVELNPEIYTELIFSLDDFGLVTRLGGRLELFNDFWAGVEIQWPDSEYFVRLQYIPVKIRRPYAWWRWSPELKAHEAAFGYRIDEHVSVEIYYDNSGDDKLGIRGMWHL